MQKEMEAELARSSTCPPSTGASRWSSRCAAKPGTKLDRIAFDSLKVDGKVLTVAWKVNQRPPHAGPGTPVSLILVDRFDDVVKFVEGERKSKKRIKN